jgi:hypothetical protein
MVSKALYRSGNYYEQKTAHLFRYDGYTVWQTRGSHGPADLICAKPMQLVLVQVKSGIRPIGGNDWNALFGLAADAGAIPVLAEWRPPDKPLPGSALLLCLWRLLNTHQAHKHTWPMEPFVLDEVDAAVSRHPSAGGAR